MVGTVVEHRFNIYYLAAGQRAFLHGFDQALFNSRYVVLRNGTAEEFFGEFEFFLGRAEADVYVAVLSGTAGLLLVLALYVGLAFNGFSVSDLLGNGLDFNAELVLQFGSNDVQLDFTLAAQEGLSGFRISFKTEGRVFFHQLLQAGADLFVVALVLGFDGQEQSRLRELYARQFDVAAFFA